MFRQSHQHRFLQLRRFKNESFITNIKVLPKILISFTNETDDEHLDHFDFTTGIFRRKLELFYFIQQSENRDSP